MKIYNMDCMLAMKEMSDNQFDLAIVDPPYGINAEQGTNRSSRKQFKNKKYGWDSFPPSKNYFKELFRISKNQIIWGANHFIQEIPNANSKHWIVWDKLNPGRNFADCELAWCSKMDTTRIFKIKRVQELNKEDGGKIHPTQKPVKLYEWLLMKYAKGGDKILDTHLGSGSIARACHNLGYDLTGYEIDKEYYNAAIKRINQHKAQKRLF